MILGKTILYAAVILFSRISDPCAEWNTFEKNVRDQKLDKQKAKTEFGQIMQKINQLSAGRVFDTLKTWVFPVSGVSVSSVGKGGFVPGKYNFYDGNAHTGHPAYDIFINDKNQDCLDDKTKKPVHCLAATDLLVLSVNTGWVEGSEIRGGNYIWLFDDPGNRFFYYAHLDSILVKPGQFCKAGTPIATLGRTGKNAWPKRSPTHLHLMVLDIKGEELVPVDYYKFLK
jgi:peptidoglycan LD-endopeptidase LytH